MQNITSISYTWNPGSLKEICPAGQQLPRSSDEMTEKETDIQSSYLPSNGAKQNNTTWNRCKRKATMNVTAIGAGIMSLGSSLLCLI